MSTCIYVYVCKCILQKFQTYGALLKCNAKFQADGEKLFS